MNTSFWLHCNKCRLLAGNNSTGFWFTSCGHLICAKCHKSAEVTKGICIVCKKSNVSSIPLLQHTRNDILNLFRQPQDLLTEYTNKTKRVMGFQQSQCQQLIKYLYEKCEKAVKFAQNGHVEFLKRVKREQVQMDQMKIDLAKTKEYAKNLEKIVAERDKEIERLKRHNQSLHRTNPSPYTRDKVLPSLNGPTPVHTLSFFECITSTPHHEHHSGSGRCTDMNSSTADMDGTFNFFGTPYQSKKLKSPVVAAAPHFPINTPILLGLSKEQHDSPSPMDYF